LEVLNELGAGAQGEEEEDGGSALGAVGGAEGSGVEADGAVGDSEPYTEAPGVGAASLVDSVEGAEDVGEIGLRDARAVVGDFDGSKVSGSGLDAVELAGVGLTKVGDGFGDAEGDLGASVGVADGVANYIFDGAIEEVGIASDSALIVFDEGDGAGTLAGFILSVGQELTTELVERDGLEGRGVLSGFHRGEGEKLADELVELGGFALNADKVYVDLGGGIVAG